MPLAVFWQLVLTLLHASVLSDVTDDLECAGGLRSLRAPVRLPLEAPQGITIDEGTDTLWISSAISYSLLQVDRQLRVLGRLDVPFPPILGGGITGVAYFEAADSFFVANPRLGEVWEIDRGGEATGRVLPLSQTTTEPLPEVFPRGIAFDGSGDSGAGSIWVIEASSAAILEIGLAGSGEVLRSFCHPDDSDGCSLGSQTTFSRDVGIVSSAGGDAITFEVIGGVPGAEVLHRVSLSGEVIPPSLPLRVIGGSPGGFVRDRIAEAGGGLVDVYYVTVESSAELHVLERVTPKLLPITEFACRSTSTDVELSWRNYDAYERIELYRDEELAATLAGTTATHIDPSPRHGVLDYRVRAVSGECTTDARCTAVMGAGRVMRSAPFDYENPFDMTQDADGNLWVTTADEIVRLDRELNLSALLPGPFTDDSALVTGIAFDEDRGVLYVYDTVSHSITAIEATSGDVVDEPFPSGLPPDPEVSHFVTKLLFDADGAGGEGTFWLLDTSDGALEERSRAGELLRRCPVPGRSQGLTAEDEPRLPPLAGLSGAEPRGFTRLEFATADLRAPRVDRIVELDIASCSTTGQEIPLAGIAAKASLQRLIYHRSRVPDIPPTAYVVSGFAAERSVHAIDVSRPPVPHPSNLSCAQLSSQPSADIEFDFAVSVDEIEIRRDGEVIAVLPGEQRHHVDVDVSLGEHHYSVRGRIGTQFGDERTCSLVIGPGSLASYNFDAPSGALTHQVVFDSQREEYIAAASLRRFAGELRVFDRAFAPLRSLPSPFVDPFVIAALALRETSPNGEGETGVELYCLGWQPGALPGAQRVLPVRVVDGAGATMRAFEIAPPEPRGSFVTFPSGMAWDAATDTLWYLERNAAQVVNVDLNGTTLASFPHPAPIHQDGVQNFGIAIASHLNTLYLTSADVLDQHISKIVEVSRSGRLTGVEIPVNPLGFYENIRGFTLLPDATQFVVAASGSGNFDWLTHRAFAPVPPVRDLRSIRVNDSVELEWSNAAVYEAVAVIRDGVRVATLAGESSAWTDHSPLTTVSTYRVAPLLGQLEGPGVVCETPTPRPFLRGDADPNGSLDIADPVAILNYLFLSATEIACLDAADGNDDGSVDISDPIGLLNFLFVDGTPPAFPHPLAGFDPTPDELECR